MPDVRASPSLGGRPFIDAYGDGGFRLRGERHRGSLLLLPSGVRAWPVTSFAEITAASFEAVLSEKAAIEFLLVGTGAKLLPLEASLRQALAAQGLPTESMDTGAACRTYNVLIAEGRRVAVALIAVP